MDQDQLRHLLEQVATGDLEPSQALERLKNLPFENLGFAHVDHHRALRTGFPEVIFGQGKTREQVLAIAERINCPRRTSAGHPRRSSHSPSTRRAL